MEFEIPRFDGKQEYLFWVGCTGALVERNVKVTQALARLLNKAGVSFGCLGEEETCSGDPARRLGNEYLYQMQATQNIETFQAKTVQKVITTCPHCFNTMKNEYPQFNGLFDVRHHTEVLAELIADGKLQVEQEIAEKVTYHDSCFLGRHNDIYEPPRDIIRAIPGAQEVTAAEGKAAVIQTTDGQIILAAVRAVLPAANWPEIKLLADGLMLAADIQQRRGRQSARQVAVLVLAVSLFGALLPRIISKRG